ncbi:MAG: HAD-IA family hydrolase, partial [Hyphomicrobiales bacterium]|nr:HAD-IA family hydrolase [Hyphomicrobiales bacterium]
KGLERVLNFYELADCFRVARTADDGPAKPAPDLLLDAMRQCNAPPEATVMVGDTHYDMQMARAAGAHALGVAWGYQDSADLLEAGAAEVLDTPLALLQFLRRRAWQG